MKNHHICLDCNGICLKRDGIFIDLKSCSERFSGHGLKTIQGMV